MPSVYKWETTPTSRLVITTELTSLANNGVSAASTAVANNTNLDKWGYFKFETTPASAPSAGAHIVIHILPALDGSEYPDKGSDTMALTIPFEAVSGAKVKQPITPVLLPPCSFTIIVENFLGVAFGATTVLTLYTVNDESQ